MGAVGDIQLAIAHFGLQEHDTIVVGGDTLFYSDFSLASVISALYRARANHPDCSAVLSYTTDDAGASKYGILEIQDTNHIVTAFLEKPGPVATRSRWACPCFYILSTKALSLVTTFLQENADAPLSARDAPGNFIRYLFPRVG